MHLLFCDCRFSGLDLLRQAVWDQHNRVLGALSVTQTHRSLSMEKAIRDYVFAIDQSAQGQVPEQARDTLCTALQRLKRLDLSTFR